MRAKNLLVRLTEGDVRVGIVFRLEQKVEDERDETRPNLDGRWIRFDEEKKIS